MIFELFCHIMLTSVVLLISNYLLLPYFEKKRNSVKEKLAANFIVLFLCILYGFCSDFIYLLNKKPYF